MKAFVITLQGNEYSEAKASNCIASAEKVGLHVETFYGVDQHHADVAMNKYNLKWTWAKNNMAEDVCRETGLKQFPYNGPNGKRANIRNKIGCSLSHYILWKMCVELDEPILILEHDAVFLRPLPEIEFNGICQINDPAGATRNSAWWSLTMVQRGEGVFEKTWKRPCV